MAKENGSEKPKKQEALPPPQFPQLSLTPERREALLVILPAARKDLATLSEKLDQLRKNYPDEFQNIQRKHPSLSIALGEAQRTADFLNSDNKDLSDEDILKSIDAYNEYAKTMNQILRLMRNESAEAHEREIVAAANGELEFDENSLTPEQQAELRNLAMDLWEELFPPSYTDKFVKWTNGQKQLEGYQKILLAPANGIESVVGSVVSLLHPKTYTDLALAIQTTAGMSYKDWCATWKSLKFLYERLPMEDKIAPVLSLICGIAFLFGGATKILQYLDKAKYSSKLKNVVKAALVARTVTHRFGEPARVLPLATIAGVSLKYIHSQK